MLGKTGLRHPGTANLYSTGLHVMDGGSPFRARFGVERNGETLLAEGSYTEGSELTDGYPEFTMAVLQKLGWDRDLTPEELGIIQTIGDDMGDIARFVVDDRLAASNAWRSAMAATPTGMARPGRLPGICRIRCRSTASRSIRPGWIL